MRISDWSSDVCSSDLRRHQQAVGARVGAELHVPVERAGQIAAAKAPLPLRRRGLEAPAIKAPLLRSGRGLEAPAIQSPSPAQREREARSAGGGSGFSPDLRGNRHTPQPNPPPTGTAPGREKG